MESIGIQEITAKLNTIYAAFHLHPHPQLRCAQCRYQPENQSFFAFIYLPNMGFTKMYDHGVQLSVENGNGMSLKTFHFGPRTYALSRLGQPHRIRIDHSTQRRV